MEASPTHQAGKMKHYELQPDWLLTSFIKPISTFVEYD